MCTQESICESRAPHPVAAFVLGALLAVPTILVVLAGYAVTPIRQADEESTGPRTCGSSADRADRATSEWRGPGVYLVTKRDCVDGHWVIHYDGARVIAFAPY
jgi:hypothetical protein